MSCGQTYLMVFIPIFLMSVVTGGVIGWNSYAIENYTGWPASFSWVLSGAVGFLIGWVGVIIFHSTGC